LRGHRQHKSGSGKCKKTHDAQGFGTHISPRITGSVWHSN